MKTITFKHAKKIGIVEIAKKAQVSTATVSRALNPETRRLVAEQTCQKIDTLVARYSYAPNLAARNMRATHSHTLGILMPHIPNVFVSDYYSKLFSGISNELIDSGYRFKMVALKPNDQKWDRYPFKAAEGVDGLIVTYWPTFFSPNCHIDVPSVFIGDPEPRVRAHFVCTDNIRGGELAAELLHKKGHRKIAILTGHTWSTDSQERVKGFKHFMSQHKVEIAPEMIVRANYEEEDAARAVEKMLKENKKFTALFCCNDNMAMGALQALKRAGVPCPGEVSVIGFDDESRARYTQPALTTIQTPVHEIGRTAVRILLGHLAGEKLAESSFVQGVTLIPVMLVERDSVASKR